LHLRSHGLFKSAVTFSSYLPRNLSCKPYVTALEREVLS
jgi:hypothetical protein